MRFGVVVFPGTWSDRDCYHVLRDVHRQEVEYVWHRESNLARFDCVVLPGGFSYGDYLRPGAVARFSPVMQGVADLANRGKLVIGICNGFQVLCEAGILPGALLQNDHLQFRCAPVHLRVERTETPFTSLCRPGQVICIPISHHDGNYFAEPETLERLESEGRIVFRYCTSAGEANRAGNPNGSLHNIAGIVNGAGNVLGMMPHPERCGEAILGGTDGNFIWESIIKWARNQ